MLLGVPFVLFCFGLPTVLFHIRVTEDRIQHVFLSHYILSDFPISDFQRVVRFEGVFGAVLHFQNGKIRFYGAHIGEINRLTKDLNERKRQNA